MNPTLCSIRYHLLGAELRKFDVFYLPPYLKEAPVEEDGAK